MVGLFVAATVLLGCGIEGQPFGSEGESKEDNPVVSGEDVAETDEGSPERTAMTWWRGVQTRNPDAVVAAYAPDVRAELPEGFSKAIVMFLAPPASETSIKIDGVEKQGEKKATLYVTFDSPETATGGQAVADGQVALPMRKVGGQWLFSNSTFLTSLSSTFETAVAALDAAADGG